MLIKCFILLVIVWLNCILNVVGDMAIMAVAIISDDCLLPQ